MQKYIRAKLQNGYWIPQIYHWEDDKLIVDWGGEPLPSKENAIDVATQEDEKRGWDSEIDWD